jgi:DNA-binding transcriptional LysR family regulator
VTLDQLTTFLWIARLGGVRRAAERQNLSQPAVSGRLAALEDDLGVRLFDRAAGAMRLTPAGHRLLVHAERVTFSIDEIRAELQAPEATSGVLRVGVSETVAQAWLPDFVARLARAHPRLTVEVSVDISTGMREALLAGVIDLAILMGPVSEFSIDNLALPPFDLGWFKAAGRGAVDLGATPVVTYARNTRPHRELAAELQRRYGPAARLFPSTSLSAAFEMVAADLGVAALPLTLARPMIAAGRVVGFDPGWRPSALRFTASWRAEPRDIVAERAARIALQAAEAHAAIGETDRE